jgi:hypothetical protein
MARRGGLLALLHSLGLLPPAKFVNNLSAMVSALFFFVELLLTSVIYIRCADATCLYLFDVASPTLTVLRRPPANLVLLLLHVLQVLKSGTCCIFSILPLTDPASVDDEQQEAQSQSPIHPVQLVLVVQATQCSNYTPTTLLVCECASQFSV